MTSVSGLAGGLPVICSGAAWIFFSPVRALLLPSQESQTHRVHIESRAPVVILVLDELPLTSILDGKGDIDAVRYPSFARFAADAYWFRDATTVVVTDVVPLASWKEGMEKMVRRESGKVVLRME